MVVRKLALLGVALSLALAALSAQPALAQKQYGPGVSDTEIKIGQTIAYSGPASAYGTLGKVEAAYFKWLNETKGASTAARSPSLAATTHTRLQRRWRMCEVWWKAMR